DGRLPAQVEPRLRGFALIALGVTFFLTGLAASWTQDVAAPWINGGEAKMGATIAFNSDGGRYRVVTSGPSRPDYDRTGCTLVDAGGRSRRLLGGTGANPNDRLGVSRVLEFTAARGEARLTCADRYLPRSTFGRFQVVPADGIVSKAIIAAFVLGGLSLLGGAVLLFLAYRRDAA
ncbi:MAG TPA: hypothetical protein VFZ89_10140, partial [Solirubrobacteraceae bacterium]